MLVGYVVISLLPISSEDRKNQTIRTILQGGEEKYTMSELGEMRLDEQPIYENEKRYKGGLLDESKYAKNSLNTIEKKNLIKELCDLEDEVLSLMPSSKDEAWFQRFLNKSDNIQERLVGELFNLDKYTENELSISRIKTLLEDMRTVLNPRFLIKERLDDEKTLVRKLCNSIRYTLGPYKKDGLNKYAKQDLKEEMIELRNEALRLMPECKDESWFIDFVSEIGKVDNIKEAILRAEQSDSIDV